MRTTSRRRCRSGIFSLLCLGALSAGAEEVSFRKTFEAYSGMGVIVISLAGDDVLVIEPGHYDTAGRKLVIRAAKARVEGPVRIGFFDPASRPPVIPGVAGTGDAGAAGQHVNCARSGCPADNGKIGKPGATGTGGAGGTSMFVDLQSLSGPGQLVFVTSGQAGGEGQQGGKGGTGGRGGNGAKRSCGGLAGLDTRAGPGDGGRGGDGGPGGTGGTGGPGGPGGAVTLSPTLAPLVGTPLLAMDHAPAQGGPGGKEGARGDQGGGGGMGGGNSCGGGGTGGSSGNPGALGGKGPQGSSGNPGTARTEAT